MNTRPTTDRVKESLFNIINHLIDGSVALDLFSGSGSLGIEALSRGAKMVVFCDKDVLTVQLIKKNLRHCNLEANSVVLACDYKQTIKKLALGESNTRNINLVFLDPPYNAGLIQDSLKRMIEANILTKDAIIVAEHSRDEIILLPEEPLMTGLSVVRTEKYGDTCISFIKRTVET